MPPSLTRLYQSHQPMNAQDKASQNTGCHQPFHQNHRPQQCWGLSKAVVIMSLLEQSARVTLDPDF